MRTAISFPCLLTIVLLFTTSCHKDESIAYPNAPAPGTPVPGQRTADDYFWAQSWQRTARGQEIVVTPDRLTQEALDKGIVVSVAIDTEMTTFAQLPATIKWPWGDIQLSFKAEPGKIYVIAQAPYDLTLQSDVRVQYQR